jgi:5-methylcytosine-specific restriction endonuclease McrA
MSKKNERQKKRQRWKRNKRGRIYSDQGGRCFYCGVLLPYEDCTLDHFIPKAVGGQGTTDNLVIACFSCNQKKADYLPHEPVVVELRRGKK